MIKNERGQWERVPVGVVLKRVGKKSLKKSSKLPICRSQGAREGGGSRAEVASEVQKVQRKRGRT